MGLYSFYRISKPSKEKVSPENVAGTYVIKGNVVTMKFEDDDNVKGHIDVVPGIAFTIYEEDGENWTFNYCKEDLSDEILGMWVCNDFTTNGDANMMIETFYENGKSTLTGFLPLEGDTEQVKNEETGEVDTFLSRITVMATGGCEAVYRQTTNPLVATGDGIAMVYRAKNYISATGYVLSIVTVLFDTVALCKSTSVKPHQHWTLSAVLQAGSPHIEPETILAHHIVIPVVGEHIV